MYFASMEITRTFAPAFGKEAAMLDRMLHRRLARCAPDGMRLGPAFRKRGPSGRPFPGSLRKKTSKKKLRETFGGLKITPYLCTRFWEGHSGAPLRKKNFEKSSAKIWRICQKLLTFATAFPETEGVKKERSLMRFT